MLGRIVFRLHSAGSGRVRFVYKSIGSQVANDLFQNNQELINQDVSLPEEKAQQLLLPRFIETNINFKTHVTIPPDKGKCPGLFQNIDETENVISPTQNIHVPTVNESYRDDARSSQIFTKIKVRRLVLQPFKYIIRTSSEISKNDVTKPENSHNRSKFLVDLVRVDMTDQKNPEGQNSKYDEANDLLQEPKPLIYSDFGLVQEKGPKFLPFFEETKNELARFQTSEKQLLQDFKKSNFYIPSDEENAKKLNKDGNDLASSIQTTEVPRINESKFDEATCSQKIKKNTVTSFILKPFKYVSLPEEKAQQLLLPRFIETNINFKTHVTIPPDDEKCPDLFQNIDEAKNDISPTQSIHVPTVNEPHRDEARSSQIFTKIKVGRLVLQPFKCIIRTSSEISKNDVTKPENSHNRSKVPVDLVRVDMTDQKVRVNIENHVGCQRSSNISRASLEQCT
ncbi:unnamed protein product [Allacma fusca]|uniref:Uncharacterized protein n=1 Tax=Allacma fusca TaxID=39272 RepID=A0A8J2KVS3_9HEXA|nr:unnamed protein product [Allacma fusca]